MGKEVRGHSEGTPLAGGGIGRYLSGQRQLRGISLEELAEITRIPIRSLERLESGVFDAAPDGFVRGFVRTVAAALGLDPDEAVMRLLREPQDEAIPAAAGMDGKVLVLRVALGIAVVLLGIGLWALASELRSAVSDSDTPEIVLRRDPVRALAGEMAGSPP